MRRIEKLALTLTNRNELAERQMNYLIGGARICECSCTSQTSTDNRDANYSSGNYGYSSTSGCNAYIQTEYGSMCDPDATA